MSFYQRGPPKPQELVVNQQFFVRPFTPQFPPISPNPQMGSQGNNVRGYGRHPWPSFQRNYYPYDRRRRSHLDDIYLPNYEDDDLELDDKPDFREQQFYNDRFHGYTRRSEQRHFYSRPSFVKRAQPRSTCHNNTKDARTENNSALRVISCAEDASSSCAGGDQDKNCDRKKEEVNINDENIKKECENSAKECRVGKNEPKTEDILCDTERFSLGDGTKSVSHYEEKTKMTEDSKSESITSNSSEKSENSVPKGDRSPEVTDATSDDESEYPYGFLTLDNIDTTKSYLVPSFLVLDNYEVKDMDISPIKRKNESSGEDEVPRKKKYDGLYFNINSDRLLDQVNEVFKENRDTSGGSTTKIKRFRSKSLTLENTSTEITPLVRSGSVDSVNRHKVKVAYDFDLKTNLLLLLKRNETSKKVETCSFKDVLKVLKGDGHKEASSDKEIVSSEDPIINTEDDESSCGADAVINSNVAQEVEILTEGNSETWKDRLEEARREPGIVILEDVQLKPPNKKEDIEKSIDSVPSVQSGHFQSNVEETSATFGSLKRKGCNSKEEQPKKMCLDPVVTNIEPNFVGKTDNTDAAVTAGSVEFILEDNSHDISLDNVELCNRSLSRGSQESESLADIEAELKSLLSVDTINKHPESVGVHRKELADNKIQEKITINKKSTVSIDKKTTATNIDDKTGSKANICSADTETFSDIEKKRNVGAKEHLRKEEIQSRNDKTDIKKEVDARKDRASTSKLLRNKPVKKQNTVSKNQLNSDSVHRKTTSSTSQFSFKPVGVLQKPQVKANATKSKSISYHEYFKRIRSLFGSDSESEMEEEKMINQKANYNKDNKKHSNNKKVYEESTKNEKQARNRVVISNTAQRSGPTYTNFKIDSEPLSLKELSKAIEKRRCSAPVRDQISPLKLSDGSPKTNPTGKFNPKQIKKRRETMPATLTHELSKNNQPNREKSVKARNDKKEKTEKVCIINPRLKDPRKDHHRYKSLEGRNESIGKKTANRQTAKPNPTETQAKIVEKSKPHQDSEKKDFSPQNTVAKMNHCAKKRNMTRNDKEKTRENPAIDQIVQLPTKSPKNDQSAVQTVTADSKDAVTAKKNAAKAIELRIKNSRQEMFQLKLQFCSTLSQDRFPLLQRAGSLVQENECCDTATTLDSVDVNDKITTVTQVTEQEDDVIEIRPEIPVIDLTDDLVKEDKVIAKVETKEEKPTIVDKCEEMITLYRSEETVNSSLDIQVTSESISPSALLNNQSQSNDSSNVQVYNNSVPRNVDNCNTTPSTVNPAPYIRPLGNNVVHAPLTREFSSEKSICDIQPSNRLSSGGFATSPNVSQTSRPPEAYNANNVNPSVPPVPDQRHTITGNNIQINLNQNYGTGQADTANRANLVPPVQQLPATVQQNINTLWRTTNHNPILQQHPLLYRQITLTSESRSSNSRVSSESVVHNPMRHANEEGPAPLHEFNSQEIKSTGVVLVKFLLLFETFQEAQCAYKNKLLKIQRYMPAIVRLQIFHFETYAFGRNSRLYKELLKELKGLKLTGRSSSVKGAELLINQTFRALQPMVADLTLWRVYLMLDSLMQPEAVEYISVPFLRDLYGYVSFVAGRIRGKPGAAPVPPNPQVAVPPRDHFTQEQRAILHWQIKQYNLIRSTQDSLIKRLRNNIPRRPSNGTITVPQITQQPPVYSSGPDSTVQTSYGHTSAGKSCPNVTVHQNIVIRPVEAPVSAAVNTSSPSDNQRGCVLNDNDGFRIQLPYSSPNDGPPTTRISSERDASRANEKIASPVPNSPVPVHRMSSPKTEVVAVSNGPTNEDSTVIRPSGTENNVPTEGVTVKEEEKKPSPLLTEQEIQTIDLTWIDDIDPEQLENEMEFIAVKKEEPADEEEEEEEVALNEEPFAVAPSPADSGISSPPIQVEYDETVFSNRSCICEKVAEYVCGCMMAMYCSVKCQAEDWRAHKEVCQKYKSRNGKDSKQQ